MTAVRIIEPAPRDEGRLGHGAPARSRLALWIGGGITMIASLSSLLLYQIDRLGGVIGAPATIAIVCGVFVPHRATLAAGTAVLAAGSLVATADEPTVRAVTVNALFALVCIAVLVGADLAYSARRSTTLAPPAVEGFVAAHAAATLAGLALVGLSLSAVLAVTWPRWLLLLPAAALPVGSLLLVGLANRYHHGLNLSPQAAPPTGAPVAAPAGSRAAGSVPPPPRPSDRVTSRRRQPPPPPPPPPAWRG